MHSLHCCLVNSIVFVSVCVCDVFIMKTFRKGMINGLVYFHRSYFLMTTCKLKALPGTNSISPAWNVRARWLANPSSQTQPACGVPLAVKTSSLKLGVISKLPFLCVLTWNGLIGGEVLSQRSCILRIQITKVICNQVITGNEMGNDNAVGKEQRNGMFQAFQERL